MKVSVIVPTYRRVDDLQRCFEALATQSRPADELLVVVQQLDDVTRAFLDHPSPSWPALKVVWVEQPGQVLALNAGLAAATGDIISITDDDAAPHPEWLHNIEAAFAADEQIGGVGGRDWVYSGGQLSDASVHPGASNIVGKVQWFGRTIGNHHLGEGEAREVDILKGANMSYRKTAIAGLQFDTQLLGKGAQAHNDMRFSLTLKKRGWKLWYDPAIAVDHYIGQRFDEDQRTKSFNPVATFNSSFNETVTLLSYLPPLRKLCYLLWALLVGNRVSPGLIQPVRFFLNPKDNTDLASLAKLWAAIQGRWAGLRFWQQHYSHSP